jgi:serine/threonine-protein kinase
MCPTEVPPGRAIDKYTVYHEIASGGMASVHLARLHGKAGFARTVAVKRLHAQLAKDPEFVAMFLDEARLAARINHPNVVSTLEVVEAGGEIFLVMDYVHGEALSRLLRAARETGERPDPKVIAAIMSGVLHGLHAAHDARSELGEPLGIVHRDVSPQNVLVGSDGIARVVDFGVAKAQNRAQTTQEGQLKGKLRYMSPEQLKSQPVDRRSDVYAAATVLWEALAGVRLIDTDESGAIVAGVLFGEFEPPSAKNAALTKTVDEIVMRGLARDPARRYPTARDFATAIEEGIGVASASRVGEWVTRTAGAVLADREEKISKIETASSALAARREEPTILDPRVEASSVSLSAPVARAPHGRKGITIAAACVAVIAAVVALPRLVRRAPELRPPVAATSAPPPPETVLAPAPSAEPPAADPPPAPSPSASAATRPTPRRRAPAPANAAHPAPDPAPTGDEDLFRSRR